MIINSAISTKTRINTTNYDLQQSKNLDNFVQQKSTNVDFEDKAVVSDKSLELLNKEKDNSVESDKADNPLPKKTESTKENNDEENKKITQLKQKDKEVKAHEQAHMSAASGIMNKPAQYKYDMGPDGQKYAVSGEVSLNITQEETPEETAEKAVKIKRAALAPTNPSDQDMRVAQQAQQMEMKARAEVQAKYKKSDTADNKDLANSQPGNLVDVKG